MDEHEELPLLGAALTQSSLQVHVDWIIGDQRDIEIQDFANPDLLDGDWQGVAAHICRMLDGHKGRRGIHGPFFDLSLCSCDREVRQLVTRRLLQGLDAADAVKATNMVVHSPFNHWDYNNLDGHPNARAKKFENAHLTLAPVVARAENMGLELVIENIDDKDPAIRCELAKSFDSEAVKVSIDTGHAAYAHGTNGAPPIDYFILQADEQLAHIHIQDADGYADRHWAPGRGTINWFPIFSALSKITTNPRLIIELRDHTLIREGAAHLASLGLAR